MDRDAVERMKQQSAHRPARHPVNDLVRRMEKKVFDAGIDMRSKVLRRRRERIREEIEDMKRQRDEPVLNNTYNAFRFGRKSS